jgi:hypothetical protein
MYSALLFVSERVSVTKIFVLSANGRSAGDSKYVARSFSVPTTVPQLDVKPVDFAAIALCQNNQRPQKDA